MTAAIHCRHAQHRPTSLYRTHYARSDLWLRVDVAAANKFIPHLGAFDDDNNDNNNNDNNNNNNNKVNFALERLALLHKILNMQRSSLERNTAYCGRFLITFQSLQENTKTAPKSTVTFFILFNSLSANHFCYKRYIIFVY